MKPARWIVICLVLLMLMVPVGSAFADDFTYTVQPGDSLYSIAQKFNTTVFAIAEANYIEDPSVVRLGRVLVIPGVEGEGASEAPSAETPADPPAPEAPAPEPAQPVAEQPAQASPSGTYTVQPGDSLYAIAQKFNTTIFELAEANYIEDTSVVRLGQVLVIPGATVAQTDAAETSQPAAEAPADSAEAAPAAPTPAPAAPAAPVTVAGFSGGFELGGQTQSFANRELMHDIGMTWVKFQHKWSPGDDPAVLAGRINDAHASGFKVLLSIPGANTYPAPGTIDFAAYADFLGGVAALGPDAIEVWNEMNIDFEWPAGEIDPASYVNNMLAPAYNSIKSANPNVMVISGAPAPTGFDNGTNAWSDARYVQGMAAAGAARYMDCIGVHHNAGATPPSASSGHPAGSHYSWYYTPTLNVYYNAFGGARKVCFTELGYLSGDGFASISPNFSWAGETDVSEHAAWLAQAVNLANTSGRVRLLIIFNVDFTYYDPNGDPQAGYALVRPDGGCPACDYLR